MTDENSQHITIVHRDGTVVEFVGDQYQLVTATMGLKMVFDEGDEDSTATPVRVWSQFGSTSFAPAPVEVTVNNPRLDYAPDCRPMTTDVAMGLAPFVPVRGRRR